MLRPLFPEDLTPGSRDLCLAMRRRACISTPFGWRLELSRGRIGRPATSTIQPASLAKLIGFGLAEALTETQFSGLPRKRAMLTDAGRDMAKRLSQRQAR